MSPLVRVISDANGFQHRSYHLLSYADVQIHLPHKNCHIKIARVDAVLSTNRGVLLQMRLPFGITSAPGNFQEIMDQLTSCLPSPVPELSFLPAPYRG